MRRVLIFLPGSLGDTLVTLPALRLISRAFPAAERRVLTHGAVNQKAAPMAALLAGTGLVHGYFLFPVRVAGTGRLRPLLALARQLRGWAPDVVVYLHEQRGRGIALRDGLAFRMLGWPRLVGVPTRPALQEVPFDAVRGRFEHRSEYLARSLAELGDPRLDDRSSWDLCLSDAERERARAELQPLAACRAVLAMSIGTKVDVNDWEDPNWQALLAALGARLPGWGLVGLGAAVERERTGALLEAWSGPRLNLCGRLDVRESGAVLERARLYVGHDSGPMHLAATVGTPCIGIFSARNPPGRWYPYGEGHRILYKQTDCYGCRLSTCAEFDKKCIRAITVDEVVEAVMTAVAARESSTVASPDALSA